MSATDLANKSMHTVHYGADTMTNLGPKLWKLVPEVIKNASPSSVFKFRIKTALVGSC